MKSDALKILGDEISTALEHRKTEIVTYAGGIKAVTDLIESQRVFLERAKEEMIAEINAGKLTQDIANFALSWINKSNTVSLDYLAQLRSKHDLRSGELKAFDATRKLVEKLGIAESMPLEVLPEEKPSKREEKNADTIDRIKKSRMQRRKDNS